MPNIIQYIGVPSSIEHVFEFDEDVFSIQDVNNPVIQKYPDYLSLTHDFVFFDALNSKLSYFHNIDRIQPYISIIDSFIRDSQGRIFEIQLNHPAYCD